MWIFISLREAIIFVRLLGLFFQAYVRILLLVQILESIKTNMCFNVYENQDTHRFKSPKLLSHRSHTKNRAKMYLFGDADTHFQSNLICILFEAHCFT